MATDTAIAPPEGFVLDAPSAATVPPPAGFVLDSGPPSAPKQGLTLAQMARLKTMPGMPGMFPPMTAIQRDAAAAGRTKPGSPQGFGSTLKDVGGRMAGSAGDILSLEAIRPHLEPGEMKGIPPWLQTAERVSEAAGGVSAPVLTGAGMVGPILGAAGPAGQALSRLAIPAAGAFNLRNLGKATGAVAGTPPAQRQPGEMAAALVGDAGSAIVDTLAVLSAPTGSASEKIQAAKARMESALKPKVEPDIETMKRVKTAPFTPETVPKPPVKDIPPEVVKTVVQGAQILPRTASAVAEILSKPLTQEAQNASSQQQTAKIHGPVQSQPIQSAGQVPAEVSSGGIQSQPAQEAQEAVGQPSALPVNHSERIAKAESEIEKMTGGDTSIADGMRLQADKLGWSDERYANVLEGVLGRFKAKLPAPTTTQDLRPALKQSDGTIIPGQEGQTHAQIKLNAAKQGIDALNAKHGFVDARGNFMTRDQAAVVAGEKEPLQSERLAELQAEPMQEPPLSAGTLSPEQINLKAPNAFLRVPTALLSEPGKLGAALTENAAVSGKQNRTATRRLTILEKPGKPGVAVVSTYKDPSTGKVMMAHPDLPKTSQRPHRSLNQMRAEGWVPRGTILLNDPVTNFRESYPSLEAAQKAVGWPEPQTTQSQNVPQMGFEGQRPVPVVQPSQGPSEGLMTPDQAGVLHDHFSKFDSFPAAMDGLAKAPKVASLKQTFYQIMEGFPEGPDREEATMNALSKLYEDARRSKKVEFVDAVSSGSDPSTHPGESGAEPGLGREVQEGHDKAEGGIPGDISIGPGAAAPSDVGADQEALGLKPANATFQRINRATSNYYKGFKQLFARRGVKVDLPKLANAADNIPRMAGQAAGNSLKLRGNKEQLSAATFVMQAHKMSAPGMPFDADPIGYLELQATDLRTAAQQFRNNKEQLEANAAIEAAQHIQYAVEHWDELQPLANQAKKQLDAQYMRDVGNGVNVQYEDWYVPQRHDIELFTSSTGPVVLGHAKGGGPSTQFKKAKAFPDYATAIQAGFVPRTLDISNLVENRVFQGEKIIQRKFLFDQMRDMKDPVDGKPLATEVPRRVIHRPDGTSDVQESVPLGYTKFEVMPGYNLAVHDGYSRLMSALTSSSQIAESAVMGGLQDLAAIEKHIGLALDSFHASRVLQRAGTIMHKAVLGDTLTRGKALVEYQPDDLPLAVKQGEITQDMADWASQPRTIEVQGQPVTESRMETVKFGVKNGLNAGRVADVLYRQWLNDMPGIGAVQRWVFDKMTRSAVTQSYLIEFERVAKANPDMTATAVARKVASDLNVLFGNLQKESIFKNPSVRSINQILFLAPQWVESLARGEWRGYKQLGQGAYRAGTGKGFHFGTAAKSMGTGLAAYFIGTQLLNLATRHQLTFYNKEKGHKLDAWIPDPTGKTPGFFLSPLSVFAEITHEVLKYGQQKPDAASAVTQILENKLGNLGRSLEVLFSGRDPITNEKLIGTWNRALKASSQAVPVPITVSQSARMVGHAIAPGTVAAPRPGMVQRQLTSSLGFKTDPARTGIQQMFDRARDWEAKSSDPKVHEAFERREKETFALSDYAPLRDALQSGDAKASQEAWSKLNEAHTLKQIFTEMKTATHRPFTGGKESEKAFIRSLDEDGKAEYLKAVQDRAALYQKFLQFVQSQRQ
jgi:hypothetical protein